MNERTSLATRLLVTHIFLQILMVFISAFLKGDFFLFALITQIVLIITYHAGYWEFFGRKFRIIFLLVLEGILVTGAIRKYTSGNWKEQTPLLVILLGLIALYLIFNLVKIFIVIYKKDPDAVEIAFPFRNGRYLVTDGGNSKTSRLMNYHYFSPVHMKNNTNRSMLYATDIVKLPGRSGKFMPPRNENYLVFGEKLYSPMDGVVFKAINTIDDNTPFSGNYPYNTGNTVVIRNEDLFFLIGHMKKNSISVSEGESVHAGDPIGAAGNSGMSERPHLHMQMMKSMDGDYWKGSGINILFRGKNLYKNRMINV